MNNQELKTKREIRLQEIKWYACEYEFTIVEDSFEVISESKSCFKAINKKGESYFIYAEGSHFSIFNKQSFHNLRRYCDIHGEDFL